MKYITALSGIVICLALAFIVSTDKRKALQNKSSVIICLVIQVALAAFLTRTTVGVYLINIIVGVFSQIMNSASIGINFVFGDLVNKNGWNFLLGALMPIVFICALIGILKYFKIIQFLMRWTGYILNVITKSGKLESFSIICAMTLGMAAPFIAVKEQIEELNKNQIYTLAAATISSVDLSILASYMKILNPQYVVLALMLNIFSFLIILSVIAPGSNDNEDNIITRNIIKNDGFFEILSEHIIDGFKIVGSCAAMVVAFIALIDLFNSVFSLILGVTFQHVLGYIFSPLAFLMGIPWIDCVSVGGIMATKLISNEFVAMLNLNELSHNLSSRSLAITSVFLISFANFGSVGIIVGIVKGLSKEQGKSIARYSLKLIYGSSLVSFLTAVIAGIFF